MAVAVPPSLFAPELAPSANNTLTIRTVNYEIVHQVEGRLRVHVPRLSHDEKFAQRLVDSVSALPSVKKARASRDTSSLVVLYHETPGSKARKRQAGSDSDSVVSGVIGCIRTAAKADVARNMASERNAAQAAEAIKAPHTLPTPNINYVKQLGIPALGLGLSAALTAGLAVPASLVGATVAAATIPHALRALQGLRTEKRLTVEILDVAAVGLLLSQSSFLAPAFMMAVTEGAEVVRSWTARRAEASRPGPAADAVPACAGRARRRARTR